MNPFSLRVISGPHAGHTDRLERNLVYRFGCTQWCDCSFPLDQQLGDEHFTIEGVGEKWMLSAMNEHPLMVNEKPASSQSLYHGDEIQAGQTVWRVDAPGLVNHGESSADPPAGKQNPGAIEAAAAALASVTAVALCEQLDLKGPAAELAEKADSPMAWVDALAEAEDHANAFLVRAVLLGHVSGVNWAIRAMESTGQSEWNEKESAAIEIARKWVAGPKNELCLEALQAAESLSFEGAAGMLAAAVFWTGDNLAPPESGAIVPPEPVLSSRGVAASLTYTLHSQVEPSTPTRFKSLMMLADEFDSPDKSPPAATG